MPITKATASSIAPAAKGDLVVGSATNDAAVLGVGSNDQVLTADSSTTTGLKWATASSGGMTLISETVASALSSLSFTSLGSYKQLLLVWSGIRCSASSGIFSIRFNNNSGNIYHISGVQTAGAVVNTAGNSPDSLSGQSDGNYIYSWMEGSNNANLSTDSMGRVLIDNYTSSTKGKSIRVEVNYYQNSTGAYRGLNTNAYFDSTSAVTSIDIVRLSGTSTFSNTTNSTIRLYGVS